MTSIHLQQYLLNYLLVLCTYSSMHFLWFCFHRWDRTPSDDAAQFGHNEVAEYILEHMKAAEEAKKIDDVIPETEEEEEAQAEQWDLGSQQ